MESLDSRIFEGLVDYFCEGFWLDNISGSFDEPVLQVDLRHASIAAEGIPEDRISRARKAAAVMVTSGNWRPEHI